MPVHDWTRVEAGICHAFHVAWIGRIQEALNSDVLPGDYYALAEQRTAGYGPVVLTLQLHDDEPSDSAGHSSEDISESTALLETPAISLTGETDMEFYRRKQNFVSVRHVTGHEVVAVIEIVSPGNKSSQKAMRAFVDKAAALMEQRIHLLVVDLLPPTPRDPHGIHGAIWEEISGEEYQLPRQTPLTMAAYEVDLSTRAYVEHLAVGGTLTNMPLFLQPHQHVEVPLEQLYGQSFMAIPRHWRGKLESA